MAENNLAQTVAERKRSYVLLDKERTAELIGLINRDFAKKEEISADLDELKERCSAIENDNDLFHPSLLWKNLSDE